MNQFAKNLKYYREITGRTQREMAELLGIATNAYQRYEHGVREPKIDALILIADTLNISLDRLVGRDFHEEDVDES
jgi:transcriptional regulator with XRE-family HTH domain